jgi:hypothetical protein
MPEIERALRHKIRLKLEAGTLPMSKPVRTWGGPGVNETCTACNVPIGRDEMEYQVEFEVPNRSDPLLIHHLHLTCFAGWELERELILRARKR